MNTEETKPHGSRSRATRCYVRADMGHCIGTTRDVREIEDEAIAWFKVNVWPDIPLAKRKEIIDALRHAPITLVYRQFFNIWHQERDKLFAALLSFQTRLRLNQEVL